MKRRQLLAGLLALVCASSIQVVGQNNPPAAGGGGGGGGFGPGGPGGGGFDPAAFQKRMMDRIRERMDIKKDDEWSAIEPLVQKVMDARRATMGGFGGGRPPGGGGDQGNRRRGGFGTPSPEAEALQKAIDDNAPAGQVAAAVKKFRESKKTKQAALEKAEADLQAVLTPRQEAVAVAENLLN